MNLLAIDPGPEKSAYVLLSDGVPVTWGWVPNEELRGRFGYVGPGIRAWRVPDNRDSWSEWVTTDHLAIEYVYLRGGKIYQQAVDTVWEAARFAEAWGGEFTRMNRKDVKMTMCGTQVGINNTSVKMAIIEHFGGKDIAVGGGKCGTCKGKGWRGRDHVWCSDCCHAENTNVEEALTKNLPYVLEGCGYETEPGPLHGISGKGSEHIFQAIACGLTWIQQQKETA